MQENRAASRHNKTSFKMYVSSFTELCPAFIYYKVLFIKIVKRSTTLSSKGPNNFFFGPNVIEMVQILQIWT